jgi:hypothetical protein
MVKAAPMRARGQLVEIGHPGSLPPGLTLTGVAPPRFACGAISSLRTRLVRPFSDSAAPRSRLALASLALLASRATGCAGRGNTGEREPWRVDRHRDEPLRRAITAARRIIALPHSRPQRRARAAERPRVRRMISTERAKGPRMNTSIVLDADPSPLAALLLGHIRGGWALLAPCQRGASTPSFDRCIHPRALSGEVREQSWAGSRA